eukprot:CAMPEP_0119105060 /NCGR_PEP_ID=MMETSP1180-20130426/3108_1 /TAXON_ID=3052 ORGANISM="Chlamydomonas cf sp, Strain CCMP681" /NCGR_SAMPLE_ID=MMETSP1180 /ASSEMBLY_ACC=CAM_ASM_000741 /LENGTH=388 /DNA_ID=CAMNT_0007090001 /DNA_START=133 /DNA_END=1299 /DNA_ORIENTATION=-
MQLFLALTILATSTYCVHGCVWLMGEARDSLASHPPPGSDWNYGFKGDDWDGGANDTWTCKSGKNQSPINLLSGLFASKGDPKRRTKISYKVMRSNGTNIQVFNNGHTIQVQWKGGVLDSTVVIPANVDNGSVITDVLSREFARTNPTSVVATPLQFHFHATSEHTVDGVYYPLEMHIVHVIPQAIMPGCPSGGCLSVIGVLFKLHPYDADNPALESIWNVMPDREGKMVNLPEGETIDLNALVPNLKSYFSYSGSLTTPPCTEGLLWHVMSQPVSISKAQLTKYETAVGLKSCQLKNATRRSLIEDHDHDHSAAPVMFKRGSYAGFELDDAPTTQAIGTQRKMLSSRKPLASDATSSPDLWDCKVVSLGWTNRIVQDVNIRQEKLFS